MAEREAVAVRVERRPRQVTMDCSPLDRRRRDRLGEDAPTDALYLARRTIPWSRKSLSPRASACRLVNAYGSSMGFMPSDLGSVSGPS